MKKLRLFNNQYESIIGYYGWGVKLTCISTASALLGIYFAANGSLRYALICLMVSGLCDGFDGKVANLKERNDRERNFGIQIDALADIVNFGALPAVIGYMLISDYQSQLFTTLSISVFIMYVLAALIRLAYFNVTEAELVSKNKKRKYYEGLPVTSAALIIPFVYSVCCFFRLPLPAIYTVVLALLSAAFVLKIKIPKPRGRALIVISLLGLPAIIYIIFFGGI
ncbi:MAG: CDP-alcohol phosphatidyltransferase family protein [Chitinispirillia bacterium]|nr:CDP-alcohol phosphatidyltransferase family protein [Chitinispirillia bacterium]